MEPELSERSPGSRSAGATALRALEWAALAAAVLYALAFVIKQLANFNEPWFIEYDARGTTLPAWRFHGSGLFANDLTVDYMNKMYFTLGCRVLFWIGTLFANPIRVARVLPFLALGVILWQASVFAYRRTGIWGVALTIFLAIHSTCMWNRLLGFNARAFGYPLTFCFIRYVSDRNERKTLLTLVAAAVCYPAALMLLGPAYLLVLAARREDFNTWLRFGLTTLVLGAFLVVPMLRPDPRIGRPTTYAQAATLRQMGPGGFQPFYPLGPAWPSILFTWDLTFDAAGAAIAPDLQAWAQARRNELALGLLVSLLVLAAATRRLGLIPIALPAVVISGFAMFGVISLVAYRLYLPDRPLTFAFPSALVLGLPLIAHAAFDRLGKRLAPMVAAVVIAPFFLILGGNGLSDAGYGWAPYHTPLYDYFGRLPKDALVAGHPTTSQLIQTFAQRRTLFSDVTNTPFYYLYAVEIEHRMDDYFRAYYARDWKTIRDFAAKWHVDYLYVNETDFAPGAWGGYAEPWGTLARSLTTAAGPPMVLGAPPASAVIFRYGTELILDLHRL